MVRADVMTSVAEQLTCQHRLFFSIKSQQSAMQQRKSITMPSSNSVAAAVFSAPSMSPHESSNVGAAADSEPQVQQEDTPCPNSLSLQFCSSLMGANSAASICGPRIGHKPLTLAQIGAFAESKSETLSAQRRLRAACSGLVGLLLLKLSHAVSRREAKQANTFTARRVAAVHAAATREGALVANQLFWGGIEVPKDFRRAFDLSSAGARIGCAHNKGVLGCCYSYGRGVAEDRAKGFSLAQQSSDAGSSYGQFMLGKCFDSGWGVALDQAGALECWCRAAVQGHANALYILGAKFFQGHSVTHNAGFEAQAVNLWRLAADQGHASAQYKLGVMFYLGRSVEQDNVEAVRLYRLASAQEYPDAQFNLGFMIEKGLGVPQDQEEAIRWYRLAASHGRSHAATMALGRLGA